MSGTPLDEAQAYTVATGPDHAVVTVATSTPEETETARQLLDRNGAIDVYKQRLPSPATAGTGQIDLEGNLSRVRDDDELDANGLTTH